METLHFNPFDVLFLLLFEIHCLGHLLPSGTPTPVTPLCVHAETLPSPPPRQAQCAHRCPNASRLPPCHTLCPLHFLISPQTNLISTLIRKFAPVNHPFQVSP